MEGEIALDREPGLEGVRLVRAFAVFCGRALVHEENGYRSRAGLYPTAQPLGWNRAFGGV